jgi:hypothetical protein
MFSNLVTEMNHSIAISKPTYNTTTITLPPWL